MVPCVVTLMDSHSDRLSDVAAAMANDHQGPIPRGPRLGGADHYAFSWPSPMNFLNMIGSHANKQLLQVQHNVPFVDTLREAIQHIQT
jgi:hypothetical protein